MPRGPLLRLVRTKPPPSDKLVILIVFLPCLPLRADGVIASASELLQVTVARSALTGKEEGEGRVIDQGKGVNNHGKG